MPDLNNNPFITDTSSVFPTTSGVGGFVITPGLSSMNQARAELQDQLNYINNIRRMIRDAALAGGASWEDANAAATAAVPITSATPPEEEVVDLQPSVSSPQETFAGLEEEQKIGRINDVLAKNPNASVADIRDILTAWDISENLFETATGYSPEQYVENRDKQEQTPIIDDTVTTEEEPTLADIIAGWLERQVGPVTQEKIKGVLDRYGKTVEDFNEAVKDVPGIPSFEDFVTEGEPVVTGTGTGTGTVGDGTGGDGTGGDGTVGDGTVEDGTGGDGTGGDGTVGDGTVGDGTVEDGTGGDGTVGDGTGGDGGLNGPVETPQIITQLPQLPETETATGGMFAAFAASPTRTTDEVLAPDLFKLDVNIPLVQRLTQYSPTAAPQYLLSGISQRYKV